MIRCSHGAYLHGLAVVVPALLFPSIAAAAAEAAPSAGAQLMRLIAGLVFVLAMVFVLSRLLPRLGGRALTGGRGFRVVASLPVGQRERVVLLEVGNRQVMLGVAPGRVNTLHVLDEPVQAPADLRSDPGGQSGSWLSRTLGGRDS
ncbi:MAG: flagellar biosynthetic protein FliO [Gammaproteobacteria bacterium]|nr:flagellar biosynthetic protein FliO [Gammaproteobacteria bacterium]